MAEKSSGDGIHENMPKWKMPNNLNELLAQDDEGIWEDDRWEPIRLTVMKGTSPRNSAGMAN